MRDIWPRLPQQKTRRFGNILGSIGLVITLGTIIGLVLEKTGAALVMAESVVKVIVPRFPTPAR